MRGMLEFSEMEKIGIPINVYPPKVPFRNKKKTWHSQMEEKVREFVAKKHTLKEWLKELL